MTKLDELHPKLTPSPESIDAALGQDTDPAWQCLDLIAEVHTRVLDTIAGFEKVVEKAQPEFRPVADAFLAMHVRHEADLARMLKAAHRDPAADGSVFGSVNRAAVEIKSWFEAVTDKIMDQIKSAEKHILASYTDAQGVCDSVEVDTLIARHIKDIDMLMSEHAT